MSAERRGLFIVIEGLDRSGKSTQAANLVHRLESSNLRAKLMKFPGQTLLPRSFNNWQMSDFRVISLHMTANWTYVTWPPKIGPRLSGR